MAYSDDIFSLDADHHWDFDGDALDQIGAVNGTNSGGIFSDAAIAADATNCMTTNGLTDRVTLATTTEINNSAQARKAVAGWYSTTSYQAPPTRIYGEGTEATCWQFSMGFGNNMMFEVTEPTNFAEGIQIYGPPAELNRVYHLCGIFSGNAYDNEVKFFVDGVEQTNADPDDRAPRTASLDSRGVGEFGDPAGTTGIGGGVVLQQAARNGKYQHWATWGDEADALMSDSDVRITLFERGALAEETVTSDTEANMQIDVDAFSDQPNAACCIEVDSCSSDAAFTLTSDVTFDEDASIHVRYNGSRTLTWVNTSGGDASIMSAPFGGKIVTANRQTLTVTVQDATDNSAISGARVFIEADTGGDLASGTEIMNATTNGSGVATATFDYTSDQPIVARVRKGSSSFYKTAVIGGPLTSTPLDAVVLMVPDE